MIDGNGIDRLIGAVAGAVIAVLFLPPKSWSEAARRFVVGVIAGLIFMTPLRDLVSWPATPDYLIASACLVALAAWWLLGALELAISYLPSRVRRNGGNGDGRN